MSRSINYNQLIVDIDDFDELLEEKEITKVKKILKKKKFDDGTSLKHNKKYKPSRFKEKND